MSEPTRLLTQTPSVNTSDHDVVLRFRPCERHMHWAIAVPFMVCYTTALVLIFVYNPHPGLAFRRAVSWTHRISGLCLLCAPLFAVVRHRRDWRLHAHNVRTVWTWNSEDMRWLLRIVPASMCRRVTLPHQGKFNAGEKVNFMALTCTYPLLLATGLVIWFGGVPYLSWLAHFSLAALATPLLVGHVLMATVNPDTRPGLAGMISGFVDRHWARHHYHHWYHELYGTPDDTGASAVCKTPSSEAAAPATVPDETAAPPPGLEAAAAIAEEQTREPRRTRRLLDAIEAGAAMAVRPGGADASAGGQ